MFNFVCLKLTTFQSIYLEIVHCGKWRAGFVETKNCHQASANINKKLHIISQRFLQCDHKKLRFRQQQKHEDLSINQRFSIFSLLYKMTTKWYVIMAINYVYCMAKKGAKSTRNIIGKQGSGI